MKGAIWVGKGKAKLAKRPTKVSPGHRRETLLDDYGGFRVAAGWRMVYDPASDKFHEFRWDGQRWGKLHG